MSIASIRGRDFGGSVVTLRIDVEAVPVQMQEAALHNRICIAGMRRIGHADTEIDRRSVAVINDCELTFNDPIRPESESLA